jgi:DNA-binding MarR family transcriptional regulator
MDARLPLPTLLSHALVAYTIEFDNEAEHRVPHRTATRGSAPDPWLVSLVMWSNCMRFVDDDGLTVRELESLARTPTNLDGMRRWGYITIEASTKRPGPDAVIRPTKAGGRAEEIWRPLFGVTGQRWRDRFGGDEIDRLREALCTLNGRLDLDLPDCLPILGHGLFSRGPTQPRRTPAGASSALPLPALLSRVLLAFTIEYERESDVSLAIGANLLRVLDAQGVPVRDLPRLSGVSKEAISMAIGILGKKRLAVVKPDPNGSRFKMAHLTPDGGDARDAYVRLLEAIEERWRTQFGDRTVDAIREPLERLQLFSGLEPYPDGWRASVRRPDTLPHYPMVLHRGGFPDGS